MLRKKSTFVSTPIGLWMAIILLMSGCAPATPQSITELTTPTPEIFGALAPSPTPPESTLPLTCQVTDLGVYVNEEWGYCFAYPGTFVLDESRASQGAITLYGPVLKDAANPVRVSLEITTQVAPAGSALTPLVDAYLTSFRDLPWTITRESLLLGGQPAEKLEPVPGLLSSRIVMVLYDNGLFVLRFHPSDIEIAKPDLEALSQTVTGSFAFLSEVARPASVSRTITWFEFGKHISLSYDSALAPWVEARTVSAVPVNDQGLYAESQPAYAQIRFRGFHGGRPYDLPLLPAGDRVAQVRVFQTADFRGFGDDSPQGFLKQLAALQDLLEMGIDPARCAQPIIGEPALPFLPWINMQQTFCAQPMMIAFKNGRGIRYLSYYAQGPNPVLDREVFYTFQGLSDDDQYYIAAFFPVETGIFPTEPPACPQCGEPGYDPFAEWATVLGEQLVQLNAQLEAEFVPSLRVLDNLVRSIEIGQ